MAEFEIIWSIDDAEWRRALEERQTRPPGTDFAKYAAASFILFGTLQMVYQDQALFPYSTLNQSLEQHNLTLRAQGLPEIAMPPDIVGVKESWSISDLATQLHRIMSHEKFGSSLNQSATLIHTDGEIDIYLRQ